MRFQYIFGKYVISIDYLKYDLYDISVFGNTKQITEDAKCKLQYIDALQEQYYKDKNISTTEYHKAMYGYEKRLSEASQTISSLRSKRVGLIKISNEIENLKKEELMLKIQQEKESSRGKFP